MELFNKQISCIIRCPGRDERRTRIVVNFRMEGSGPADRFGTLFGRLTDENDPSFLHSLRMRDDDFQILKERKNYLIDFDAFPQQIVDLLEDCIREKYILQLTVPDGNLPHQKSILEVVEKSNIMRLTRLDLEFTPGNDGDVKKYLSDCLKLAKQENARLEAQIRSSETDWRRHLRTLEDNLQRKTDEVEQLKSDWNARAASLHEKFSNDMARERERAEANLAEQQRRFEEEKRNIEANSKKAIQRLEARNYELEAFQKDISEKKYKLEGAVVETKDRVTALEEELQRRNFELNGIRRQLGDTQRDLRDVERSKLDLEEQYRKQQETVTRLQDKLNAATQALDETKTKLEQTQSANAKVEKDLKFQKDEVTKANEIIKKLMDKSKTLAEKATVRGETVAGMKEKLDEMKKIEENLRAEMESLQNVVDAKNKELADSAASLAREKQRYGETQRALDQATNLLNYLQRQNGGAGKPMQKPFVTFGINDENDDPPSSLDSVRRMNTTNYTATRSQLDPSSDKNSPTSRNITPAIPKNAKLVSHTPVPASSYFS